MRESFEIRAKHLAAGTEHQLIDVTAHGHASVVHLLGDKTFTQEEVEALFDALPKVRGPAINAAIKLGRVLGLDLVGEPVPEWWFDDG